MTSSPPPPDHQLTESCLDFLERAYDWEKPDEPWLTSVVEAAWRLWGNASWALGLFYDASDAGRFSYSNLVFAGASPAVRGFAPLLVGKLPAGFATGVSGFPTSGFGSGPTLPDLFGINGLDSSGVGCFVGLAVSPEATTAAQIAVSHRLSTHLASAYRCRRRLRTERASDSLRPDGSQLLAALTDREHQVIAAAATGKSNKEIAFELGIGHSTTRVLLSRACRRLGVRTREELLQVPAVRAMSCRTPS